MCVSSLLIQANRLVSWPNGLRTMELLLKCFAAQIGFKEDKEVITEAVIVFPSQTEVISVAKAGPGVYKANAETETKPERTRLTSCANANLMPCSL